LYRKVKENEATHLFCTHQSVLPMNIDEEQEYYQLNQVDLYLAQNKCGTGNLVLTNK
jgi:hypothetical protein